MSEQILTEEELRFRESVFQDQYMGSIMSKKPYQYSQEIIASHRSLLSANAELSFKNMKLKEFMDWAKRIIDSGMGAGILKYEPVQFFIDYHTYLKSLEVTK